jgi:hypothetical protein
VSQNRRHPPLCRRSEWRRHSRPMVRLIDIDRGTQTQVVNENTAFYNFI